MDAAHTLLSESFENLRSSDGWHVQWGSVTGDEGTVWNTGLSGIEVQHGEIETSRATDGDSKIELDTFANASISTTLALTESAEYSVSFDYQPRPGHEDTSDMKVTFGDQELRIDSDVSGNLTIEGSENVRYALSENGDGWYTVTAVFDGIGGDTATLQFEGTGTSDSFGAYIDNIKVEDIADASLDYVHIGYEGDDILTYDGNVETPLDLGDGFDTLVVNEPMVDFSSISDNLRNVEQIDLSQSGTNRIELEVEDVLDMTGSEGDHTLRITGTEADEVDINSNDWTLSDPTEEGFTTYTANDDPTVSIQIQNDINVGEI
jgi:hypothetical protein